jgi:hypothetical protein
VVRAHPTVPNKSSTSAKTRDIPFLCSYRLATTHMSIGTSKRNPHKHSSQNTPTRKFTLHANHNARKVTLDLGHNVPNQRQTARRISPTSRLPRHRGASEAAGPTNRQVRPALLLTCESESPTRLRTLRRMGARFKGSQGRFPRFAVIPIFPVMRTTNSVPLACSASIWQIQIRPTAQKLGSVVFEVFHPCDSQ